MLNQISGINYTKARFGCESCEKTRVLLHETAQAQNVFLPEKNVDRYISFVDRDKINKETGQTMTHEEKAKWMLEETKTAPKKALSIASISEEEI